MITVGRKLQLTLELRSALGVNSLDGRRIVAHGALADGGNFEALVEKLDASGVGRSLPKWAEYVPQRWYSRELRLGVTAGIGIYTLGSVFWAIWQLYNNSTLLQRVAGPGVRQLRRRWAARFSVAVRLADRALHVGTGLVWPLWLLLARVLQPFRYALAPLAYPLYSAAAGGAAVARSGAAVANRAAHIGARPAAGLARNAKYASRYAKRAGAVVGNVQRAAAVDVNEMESSWLTAQVSTIATGLTAIVTGRSVEQGGGAGSVARRRWSASQSGSDTEEDDDDDEAYFSPDSG